MTLGLDFLPNEVGTERPQRHAEKRTHEHVLQSVTTGDLCDFRKRQKKPAPNDVERNHDSHLSYLFSKVPNS